MNLIRCERRWRMSSRQRPNLNGDGYIIRRQHQKLRKRQNSISFSKRATKLQDFQMLSNISPTVSVNVLWADTRVVKLLLCLALRHLRNHENRMFLYIKTSCYNPFGVRIAAIAWRLTARSPLLPLLARQRSVERRKFCARFFYSIDLLRESIFSTSF